MSPGIAAFALWGVAGLALGLAYFEMVRRAARSFADSRHGAPAVLAVARFAAAAVFFAVAARVGALPLLTAFLGFLVARTLVLRIALRGA